MLPELDKDDAYRMATCTDIEDDNRTAIGQVKSVRRVPVSRSTTIASKATEMMDIEFLKQEINIDDHRIPIHDLLNRLLTDINTGLSPQQAEVLLQRDGPNQITAPVEPPTWVRFVKHMFGGFAMLMWLGAFLCFAHHSVESGIHKEVSSENIVLGFALIIVIIITGVFSFIQETKENEMKEGIDKYFTNTCTVIRTVVGDIILLKMGEQVPANIRLFDARNFKVDNSSLTGESEPQWRSHNCTHENALLTENLVFYSTFVVEGTARGIVVNTGDMTVVGRLSAYSLDHERRDTPISKEITRFIHLLTVSACCLGVFFFCLAFIVGYYWIDAILFMIGIIVACVPEGILAIVTIALSVTAKRMSNKNCLVKNLEAVETLGATSVIITDKTGTLTSNKLTVAHVWFDNNIGEIDTAALETANHTWKNLARVAILCNTAEFDQTSGQKPVLARETIGDPTDSALLRCVESVEGDAAVFRQMHRTVLHIPFNPEAKIQVSVHECADFQTNGYLACMIGSPDILLQRCTTALINGQERRIDQDYKNAYYYAVTEMAGLGETVVAIADARLPPQSYPPGFKFNGSQVNFPVNGYRLLGLMSMIDPPKATVPDAISKCRAAGVKVIMVTGDHPATAAAIAKSVGIIGMENQATAITLTSTPTSQLPAGIVTGEDLENMTNEMLEDVLLRTDELVFARMKPEQKLQIVETCQRLGAVVTVTGDGINDAAAIRRADVGIAMAQTGAAYTIKCADIVLLDDDFSSIVSGIEEGRLMFENLKKVLLYALSSNVPELAAFLISMVAQIPLPLGILAVLVIDLGTDLLPAVSLAFEEPETDLMAHQPRNSFAAAGFFTYFVIMSENGFKPDRLIGIRQAWESKALNDLRDTYGQEWTYDDRKTLEYQCQAGFLMSVVIVQWAVLISTRSRRMSVIQRPLNNWVMNIALGFETILAFLVIYIPGSREGLQLAPISPLWWLPGVAFAVILIAYEELRKAIARKHKGSWIDNETRF